MCMHFFIEIAWLWCVSLDIFWCCGSMSVDRLVRTRAHGSRDHNNQPRLFNSIWKWSTTIGAVECVLCFIRLWKFLNAWKYPEINATNWRISTFYLFNSVAFLLVFSSFHSISFHFFQSLNPHYGHYSIFGEVCGMAFLICWIAHFQPAQWEITVWICLFIHFNGFLRLFNARRFFSSVRSKVPVK